MAPGDLDLPVNRLDGEDNVVQNSCGKIIYIEMSRLNCSGVHTLCSVQAFDSS